MRIPILFNMPMPEWIRRFGNQLLCDTFAEAFSVETLDLVRMPADEGLAWFKEFSCACVEAAAVDAEYAALRHEDLGWAAFALGNWARAVLAPKDEELTELVSWLYRGIRIDVSGEVPGKLEFVQCYFSDSYTPHTCAFMSAFDSGFISGLSGGGALEFSERITQGAPCCRACFTSAARFEGAGDVSVLRSLL